MRAREIIPGLPRGLNTYRVRLRLRQPGNDMLMWTTVQARNQDQARRIVRGQYGDRNVIVGNPKLLRGLREDSGGTVSGNIAVVAQPLGAVAQRRVDPVPAKYANTWQRPRKTSNVSR